jgi:hypothetical protein
MDQCANIRLYFEVWKTALETFRELGALSRSHDGLKGSERGERILNKIQGVRSRQLLEIQKPLQSLGRKPSDDPKSDGESTAY